MRFCVLLLAMSSVLSSCKSTGGPKFIAEQSKILNMDENRFKKTISSDFNGSDWKLFDLKPLKLPYKGKFAAKNPKQRWDRMTAVALYYIKKDCGANPSNIEYHAAEADISKVADSPMHPEFLQVRYTCGKPGEEVAPVQTDLDKYLDKTAPGSANAGTATPSGATPANPETGTPAAATPQAAPSDASAKPGAKESDGAQNTNEKTDSGAAPASIAPASTAPTSAEPASTAPPLATPESPTPGSTTPENAAPMKSAPEKPDTDWSVPEPGTPPGL